ncbi:stage III sporulation protein SpoIIIAB [Candidatus Clostridium radicumherbarum]|uniref:Stage III sporulation protein SpoIIIAB n=1 Tax=Candidatus Clostridium radicumherbarum TaxID=3381662 RepID=A0ABW8TW84_9CLOT
MIKFLSCFIILATSTIAGFVYAEGFRKRVKQLNEFERSLGQLENEIEYTHTPLPEALYSVSEKSESPVKEIFEKISKLLYKNEVDSVYNAFKKCLEYEANSLNLNSDDLKVILDLSKSLGESDIEGHRKIFSLLKVNLKKRINIAEETMNKNLKLYRYLGFSIGAMIVIVLL